MSLLEPCTPALSARTLPRKERTRRPVALMRTTSSEGATDAS